MIRTEYHRPFSAGPFARIHPGSLVVEFDLTRQQIHELTAALGQGRRSEQVERTSGDLSDAAKQFLAVRAHEQDHFRRFLSTTFGFLCDTVRHQWVTFGALVVAEAARSSRDRLAPFPAQFVPGRVGFSDALRATRQRAENGFQVGTLFRGHHDLLEALVDEVTPGEFASAVWGLANGSPDAAASIVRGVNVERSLCSAFPMVEPSGRAFGITARHILEFFAVGEQGNVLIGSRAPRTEVERLYRADSHEYAMTVVAWRHVFPLAGWPSEPTAPRAADDRDIEWYRAYPFELFVAADLALWPPFHPIEGLTLRDGLTWADVQAGRRFFKALSALRAMGIGPTPIPADRGNERFLALQNLLCQYLGWPTPQDLAREWEAALSHLAVSRAGYWPWLDGPANYRLTEAIPLLRARLARPADFVLNNYDLGGLGLDGVPGWVYREDSGRSGIVPMSRLGEATLVPLAMIEGTRRLDAGYSPFFGAKFDLAFRKKAVRVLSETLAAAGGWDGAIRTRFDRDADRHFDIIGDQSVVSPPTG